MVTSASGALSPAVLDAKGDKTRKRRRQPGPLAQLAPLSMDILVRKKLPATFDNGALEVLRLVAGSEGIGAVIKGWYGE